MRVLYAALVLLVFALIIQSCKKESTEPDSGSPSMGLRVDITGTVIGENESFISGALIEVNGQTTTSGDRGIFRLLNVPVTEGRNYLEVHMPGYYFGGRNFYVKDSGQVGIKVKLLPQVLIGTFNASAGAEIETSDGLKVSIPANGIEGGYQGIVNVYSHYLDPTNPGAMLEIPGLEGINSNGELGLLLSYGMGHIELQDGNGDLLQLAEGSSAQLTMPIPADLIGSAEASIALWYFDELQGLWIEEGSAELQGNKYVGEVTHFSFWNCDHWTCVRWYNINVSCGGTPYANMPLISKALGFLDVGTGITNSEGLLRTSLPCASSIDIYALPPGGNGEEFLIGNIQTDGGGQVWQTSFIQGNCGPHASVSGCAIDGSSNPITNGYIYLQFDDYYTEPVFFDENGCFLTSYFDYTPEQLSSGATIIAWDMDNFITADGPFVEFNSELNVLPEPIVIGGTVASIAGRIYVSDDSSDDFYYCLDASDGSLIWSADVGDGLTDASAAIYENKIYLVRTNFLYCLNTFDGSQIWSEYISDGNSPFVEDGVVYVSKYGGLVHAFDADDGTQLWYTNLGPAVWTAPTISGDLLYCARGNTSYGLSALNKNDGTIVWDFDAPDHVKSSPCVADGKVFFGCDNQELYALDALTGEQLWQATFDDGPGQVGSPTTGNGLVYVQSINHIRAFDMETGNEVWMVNELGGSGGANPYLDGNRLFVHPNSGPTSCFDAITGSLLYEIDANGQHFTVIDGVLLLNRQTEPKTLEARNTQTGELIWTSPVQANMTSSCVAVDNNGVAHYSTISGMRQ